MGHTDHDLTWLKMSTAGISLIGSILVLCTFYLRPLQGQFKYINISVVILSISGAVMYILYFFIPTGESVACAYQGAVFQLCFIMNGFYDAFIAIETRITVGTLLQDNRYIGLSADNKCKRRQIVYFVLVLLYYLPTSIYLSTVEALGFYQGVVYTCWLRNNQDALIYSYVPIWICALIITTCSVASVRCIRELFDNEKNPQYRMSYRTKSLIVRILIIPLCFIIFRIPGSFAKVYGIMNEEKSENTGYTANAASAGLSTLAGTVNFIVYVLLDKDSRKVWRQFFDDHHLNCFCFGSDPADEVDDQGRQVSRDSSFAGPLSVYGSGDDDVLSMSSASGMSFLMVDKNSFMGGLSISSSRPQIVQLQHKKHGSNANEKEKKQEELEERKRVMVNSTSNTTTNNQQPSGHPSIQPRNEPSWQPIERPSTQQFNAPSQQVAVSPTIQPTIVPKSCPSDQPLRPPSRQPSAQQEKTVAATVGTSRSNSIEVEATISELHSTEGKSV